MTTLLRSVSLDVRRMAISSRLAPEGVAQRLPRTGRSISSSCSNRQADSDATPARTHRRQSPKASGRAGVEGSVGEAKTASTSSATSKGKALTDLAQRIGQRQRADASSEAGQSQLSLRASTAVPSQRPSVASPPLAPSGYSMTTVPAKSDPVLKAFINNLMRDGKKASTTRYVVNMLKYLGLVLHADPLPVMKEAVRLASPLVRMQTRKEGGKNTQVPLLLFPRQSRRRGIVAILEASKKRSDSSISVRLAKEMIAVLDGSSAALTRKIDVHKLAAVNRGNTGVRV